MRRVTCRTFSAPEGAVHVESDYCTEPVGVALVPYRDPGSIRKGDVVRIVGRPEWIRGTVYVIGYTPSKRRAGSLRRLA